MGIRFGFTTILALATCAALGQKPNSRYPAAGSISGEWSAQNAFPGDSASTPNWPIYLHKGIPTTFEFKVDGNNLTGKVRVDVCPGNGVITEGKIDGDNISFTVVTEDNSPDGPRTIYYAGKVQQNKMALSMRLPFWDGRTFEAIMIGKRVPQE